MKVHKLSEDIAVASAPVPGPALRVAMLHVALTKLTRLRISGVSLSQTWTAVKHLEWSWRLSFPWRVSLAQDLATVIACEALSTLTLTLVEYGQMYSKDGIFLFVCSKTSRDCIKCQNKYLKPISKLDNSK